MRKKEFDEITERLNLYLTDILKITHNIEESINRSEDLQSAQCKIKNYKPAIEIVIKKIQEYIKEYKEKSF